MSLKRVKFIALWESQVREKQHFCQFCPGLHKQQRVAIARALSYNPDIILADEPTGNLDGDTQNEIMGIFRELANEGKCVILVSHSPEVAEQCDECYKLVKITKTKKK